MAEKAKVIKKKSASPVPKAQPEADLKALLTAKLLHNFSVQPESATNEHFYNALVLVLRDMMRARRVEYIGEAHRQQSKQVYYLCMEFLMGRSLKNTLYNLNLTEEARQVLDGFHVKLDALFELEPDAGLGNGGLGRLAACFLDGLATAAIPAVGYSLLYEYGIFRQKLVDGWQTELPDFWLPGGESWLLPRPELAKEVRFDGNIREWWDDNGFHHVVHDNANIVIAQPYDLMVAGKDGRGVSTLRLWRSTAPGMNMSLFNQGEYMRAMEQKAMAEVITQVLYPADNHREGKSLRLSQQYFLVSASVQDIVRRHLEQFGTLDNLPDNAAVHINDTHPTLAIPELMRIMLDECGYSWDAAWDLVTRTVAYTNHTVMAEALECWPEDLFRQRLPRIYQIVREINNRFSAQMMEATGGDTEKVGRMAIISYGLIKMANLCVAACHSVNGVSKLHSEIVKHTVFPDAFSVTPEKFTNVTNGIAHRRWLCQANPGLTAFIRESIGDGFVLHAEELAKLRPLADDKAALERFAAIKRENKARLSDYVKKAAGVSIDPDSLFDVQVKRLHEYKRQLLNVLHILTLYNDIKDHPEKPVYPQTFIFAAKASAGYYLAKQIISLIVAVSNLVNSDPQVQNKLKVVFIEDYKVSLAEIIIPAADLSEQISVAGKEASGTSNMKLMINGAVTLGTLDGANVEIRERVGDENMFLFGMTADEVQALWQRGYDPRQFLTPELDRVLQMLTSGVLGQRFDDVAASLLTPRFGAADSYMTVADFASYKAAKAHAVEVYQDRTRFAKMSLTNIARAGIFSSDRSVEQYAREIWDL